MSTVKRISWEKQTVEVTQIVLFTIKIRTIHIYLFYSFVFQMTIFHSCAVQWKLQILWFLVWMCVIKSSFSPCKLQILWKMYQADNWAVLQNLFFETNADLSGNKRDDLLECDILIYKVVLISPAANIDGSSHISAAVTVSQHLQGSNSSLSMFTYLYLIPPPIHMQTDCCD